MAKKISRTPRKKDDSQAALEVTDGLDHPALELENPASPSTLEVAPVSSSLSAFWETFRLSPIEREHTLLTHAGWLTLLTLGPLGLLTVLGTIDDMLYYQSGFEFKYIVANLGDPIFTTLTLSLFFGSLIISYRWYPAIQKAFVSLFQNDVLRNQKDERLTEAEYLGFLETYQHNLHSRKRYIMVVILALFTLAAGYFMLASRGYFEYVSHLNGSLRWMSYLVWLPRWVLAPFVWSYLGMLWLWSLLTTTKTIIDLTPRFQVNVQPLHSDRAGGLKKLGDLCSYVGLFIVVIVTPALVLAVQGTIMSTRIAPCGTELQLFASGQVDMTEARVTDCIYFANSRFNQISRADIANYITTQQAKGLSLNQLATAYYDRNKDFFQSQAIFTNYSIYYVMDVIVLLVIIFTFYVVIRPLLDVHNSMVEYKQKREYETNEQISELYDQMTALIKQNKFEEADKLKAHINFLNGEMAEIQKYPRWPISSLPLIRSYVSSSFITALVTYAFSLLKVSISAEASGVLNEAIKSLFGQ